MPTTINTDRIANALSIALAHVPGGSSAIAELTDALKEVERLANMVVQPPLAMIDTNNGQLLTCDTKPLAVQDTRYSTLLTADLDASTTTVPVQSFALFPSSNGYYIQIGTEVMQVTAGAGTASWTVSRAQLSTGAALHTQWDRVKQISPPITTTLASGITSTATTLSVSSTGTGYFPTEDRFYVTIDSETIYVTATAGTTWTVERGVNSAAASHSAGATITQVLFDEATSRQGVNYVNVERLIFDDSAFLQPGGSDPRTAVHHEVQQFVRLVSGPDANNNYTGYLQKWDDVNQRHVDDVLVYWRNVN